MIILPRVYSGERARLFTLAALLLINSLVQQSNDVMSTSGFVSNLGVEQILWLWLMESILMIFASSALAFIVDRMKRVLLASILSATLGLTYLGLYVLFVAGAPEWLFYSALAVINDQQLLLMPLLIWAVANDVFSVAESKRLVPLVFDLASVKAQVEQTYHCEVAAVLPHSDEMMTLASKGIFALRYPQQVMTAELKRIAAQWVAS